jgi:peptidoglycan hydrolase-like protein with peptidoglycan-binding domain
MPTAYMSQAPIKKASLRLPILRPGSSGSTVRVLQQLLNFKGFNLEIDGEFNSPTQEAVKEFQQMNGLGMEGIVDSQTWYYLSAGLLPLEH